MSSAGAALRAAVPISSARAEASRRNGAKSRGPKSEKGKARSARNALTHGMRAQKHVVLPDEDAAAFAALEAALLEELAPVGALQAVLARQIVAAAWRLARADRIEAEILIFRQREDDLGLAVTRDGNSGRALPTLLRYRGAAHAELLRSLRTLKALQAEQAALTGAASAARPRPAGRRPPAARQPSEPERRAGPREDHVPPPPGASGRTLHEDAAPWMPRPDAARTPNEPETRRALRLEHVGPERTAPGRILDAHAARRPNEPERRDA